jgi:hypothetical protein
MQTTVYYAKLSKFHKFVKIATLFAILASFGACFTHIFTYFALLRR